MRGSIKRIAILLALVLLGAILATSGSTLACHTKTSSCSPSTDQDITDWAPNNWVQYDITCHLSPGCSSHYYVAFTVDAAPPGWTRTLKNDVGVDVINPSAPSGPEITGYNWIDINSDSTYNVHLKVTAPNNAQNNDQAIITVNCWSTDGAVNDLENDPVTTTTTVNIPEGIRLYPTNILLVEQEGKPGETKDFGITIEDTGEAAGLIDMTKDAATYYEETGGGDWTNWGTEGTDYSFDPVQPTLPQDGSTQTTLSITIPTTAKQGDKLIFIARGRAQANPSTYTHTTTCILKIIEDLPDLKIDNDDLTLEPAAPHDGEQVDINLVVHNIGGKDVSNFGILLEFIGEEHVIAPETKIITETLTKDGDSMIVTFVWDAQYVTEGEHVICLKADEDTETKPNGDILEEDEDNNLAGIVLDVAAPLQKWIEGTMELDPETCNPSDTVTVSGTANYNADFGSEAVKNGDVTIVIDDTTIQGTTKTDSTGAYTKELTAPTVCKKYKVTVDIVDSEAVGLKDGKKLEKILEVRSLAVTIDLNPSYCLAGDSVLVSGKVKDPDFAVAGASVSIVIEGQTGSWDVSTDPNGVYTTTITAPSPIMKTDYTATATAVKGELMGFADDTLTVDIDTDGDDIGNDVDDDDDGDGVDDETEAQYGSDPLDETSLPDVPPVAEAGPDQTIFEGDTVSLDGSGSSDSLGGSIVSYMWDFGDSSSTESGEKLSHKYTDVGIYTVKLTVKDNDDKSAEDTMTVTVQDKPPEAEITSSKTEVKEDKSVGFDASGSTCCEVDTIESYEWDWGYNKETEIFNPSGDSGEKPSHAWSKEGTYTVAVRVTDDDGSTSIATQDIIITKGDSDDDIFGSGGKGSDLGVALLAIIVIVVIAVVIVVVFMFMKKGKKPPATKSEERVAATPQQQKSATTPPTKPTTNQEKDWNWDFRD